MAQFKCIATISWKVEEDGGADHCLEVVKEQLDQILLPPKGLDGFTVQVDLAPMKTKKMLKHIKSFSADDIFALVTENEERREFVVDGKRYSVRMNSDRYHVFRKSRYCAACGIEGTKMTLDLNPGDASPHFNLYAEEDGRLLLMTKDHIIPKSKGGSDISSNFCTTCHSCNNLKGNYDLTYEQIGELRTLLMNENRISRKELRNIVNKRREEMVQKK